MSDIIETLRNLQEVFGEGDPTRRRAAIEKLGRYVGHAALDQVAGELRAGHPSFVYTPHRLPQGLATVSCWKLTTKSSTWGSGPPGEQRDSGSG
jgi:hypothetical protein